MKSQKINNVETFCQNVSTKRTKSAFTLVELIIVITILAILRTIGFMSFQSYTLDARDGKRKRDLGVLRNGLEIYGTKNQTLLDPDNYVIISGTSYQGYASGTILKGLRISDDTKDPKDKIYYTYSKDLTGKKYQLLAMLEKQDNLAYNQNTKFINEAYARDYTTRFPYTLGGNFGIYLSGTTQTPVQEGNAGQTITDTGSLTLITSNTGASSGGTGGGGGETTYTISTCPTVNAARNGTSPTKADIIANINNYIGCNITGGQIAGYTYSGSIIPANKMIMIVETNDTARAGITQWGLFGTDLGTLANITANTNTTTMTNDIVSWDGLSNTQKILVGLTRAGETGRAAQLCNAKGTGIRYLPATEELNQLYCYNNNDATNDGNYGAGANNADCVNKGYIARNKNTLSNFVATNYWSSPGFTATTSRTQSFNSGHRGSSDKYNTFAVRCLSRF